MSTIKTYETIGLMRLNLGACIKNSDGVVVFDGGISFEGGSRGSIGIIPARYSTSDPDVQKFLDGNSLNEKNGGNINQFKEVTEVKGKKEVVAKPVDETPKTTVDGISKVQEAGDYLRQNFPGVKAVEVTTKKGIKEVCARFNVEFPNIDFTDV
jgi:hypothetical protein